MTTSKDMTNIQIARLFRAVSAALELSEGDNRFKIIAYDRAADAIEHASSEAHDLWQDKQLDSIPGIGSAMSDHLDELFRTGKVKHFQTLLSDFPPAVFELLDIPGIGPKTALRLCKALGISKAHVAVASLEKAARKGHIAALDGFGDDSQAEILAGIEEYMSRSKRLLLPVAFMVADDLVSWLKKDTSVLQAVPLGSLRRRATTVGDIDIAVATRHPEQSINHFLSYPRKARVLESGVHSASLIISGGHQVDLMVQDPESFGSLLQHFTGSKHHNIALRELASKMGYSLSEYGIKTAGGQKKFSTEESFYNFLGLDFIPPELREDTGEIQAARDHKLPGLIELSDIKGDLQIHSNLDLQPGHDLGTGSIVELAQAGSKAGYQYLGFTEHNPSVANHTHNQIMDLIKMKTKVIHEFNHSNENNRENIPYIFNGLEIDITSDGSRSLPDECLELLDYACVSIHSSFHQARKVMTDRVLAGLDHPKVRFLAHPTGRLIQEREGIDLDWDRIFDFCLTHDKWLEIDAWPDRLDLPDSLVREAVKHGIKLVIDTDSHDSAHLDYMRFGVWVGRRGWVTRDDIINTLSLNEMFKIIGKEVNSK